MKNKLKKILMLYGVLGVYVHSSDLKVNDIALTDEEKKELEDFKGLLLESDNSFELNSDYEDIDSVESLNNSIYEDEEDSSNLNIDNRRAEDASKTDENLKLKESLKKVLVAVSDQYYNDSMFGYRIDIIKQNLDVLHIIKAILEKQISSNDLDLTNKINDLYVGSSEYKSKAKAFIRGKKDEIINLMEQVNSVEKEISKKKEDYNAMLKQSEADRESKKKRLQDGVRNAKKAKEDTKNQMLKTIRSKFDEIKTITKAIDKAEADLVKANEKREVAKQRFDDFPKQCPSGWLAKKRYEPNKKKVASDLKAADKELNNAKTEQKKNPKRQREIDGLNNLIDKKLSPEYDKFCADADIQMLAKEDECRKKIEFIDTISAARMDKDKESHSKDLANDNQRLEKVKAELTGVQATINPKAKKDASQFQDCENPYEKLFLEIKYLKSTLKILKHAEYLNNKEIPHYQKLNAMGIEEKELGGKFLATLIEFSNKVTDFNRHKVLKAFYDLNHAEKQYIKYGEKIKLLVDDVPSQLQENRNALKSSMNSIFSEIYGNYWQDAGKIKAKDAFYKTNKSAKNELIYEDFDIDSLESLLEQEDQTLKTLNNQNFADYAYTPIKQFEAKQTYLQKHGMGDILTIDRVKEYPYDASLCVSNIEKFDNAEKFAKDYSEKMKSAGNEASNTYGTQRKIDAQKEAEFKANIVEDAGRRMEKSDEAINDYENVERNADALEFKSEETGILEESTRMQNKGNQQYEKRSSDQNIHAGGQRYFDNQMYVESDQYKDYESKYSNGVNDYARRQEMMEAGQVSPSYLSGSVSGFGLYDLYYNGEKDITVTGGIGVNTNINRFVEFIIMPTLVVEYKDLVLFSVSAGMGVKFLPLHFAYERINIKVLGNLYKGHYGGFVFSWNSRSNLSVGFTWARFVEGEKLSKGLTKLKMSKAIASVSITYDTL